MTNRYDIVIIGGGIHGVGVAQAAAASGYSVLLLEQNALASGTSSRSSKLIHGGLRYLETGQFSLVKECLYERSLLLKLAPELVQLLPFYIPVYPETTRRPWQLRLGLGLYSILGGLSPDSRFSTVGKKDWDTLDGLNTANLQAVFRYQDAQTDDAALTRAVMKSAIELGAELEMPATFLAAEITDKSITLSFKVGQTNKSCEAGVLINAAGPWVNTVLDKIRPLPSRTEIDLIQGTHIIVDGKLSNGTYYLEAPNDMRAVFAMPWKNSILIGTTETTFNDDPTNVKPLQEEISYLMETFVHYFPGLQEAKILSSFAGLRVLPKSTTSTFSRSRDTILMSDRTIHPKLLTIYGGKLTAYRATSEKVIQQIKTSLPDRTPIADTKQLPLSPA